MKDVAKACGVSIATVSKALNGYSDIGKGKREEIRKVADELGYLPNSSARALKTKRTYNLGILFVDEARSGLTHDYFSSIIESFKVTAEASGYDLTFVNCNMPARQSYYEHCRSTAGATTSTAATAGWRELWLPASIFTRRKCRN